MRKRGTISRCCCGDGAAGTCPDACLSNWNGCAPSHLGLIYQDRSNAFANCGWYNRVGQFPFAPVSGSNGNFDRIGFSSFGSAIGEVTKYFAFDYRLSTSISFETLGDVTSGGQPATRSVLRLFMFDRSVTLLSRTYDLLGNISNESGVIGSGVGPQINTSEIERIGVTMTFGTVAQTAVMSYTYFDGQADVTAEGCTEWLNTTTDILLNGTIIATTNHLTQFFGGRCYAAATLQLNTTVQLRQGSAQVNTSETTLSVT